MHPAVTVACQLMCLFPQLIQTGDGAVGRSIIRCLSAFLPHSSYAESTSCSNILGLLLALMHHNLALASVIDNLADAIDALRPPPRVAANYSDVAAGLIDAAAQRGYSSFVTLRGRLCTAPRALLRHASPEMVNQLLSVTVHADAAQAEPARLLALLEALLPMLESWLSPQGASPRASRPLVRAVQSAILAVAIGCARLDPLLANKPAAASAAASSCCPASMSEAATGLAGCAGGSTRDATRRQAFCLLRACALLAAHGNLLAQETASATVVADQIAAQAAAGAARALTNLLRRSALPAQSVCSDTSVSRDSATATEAPVVPKIKLLHLCVPGAHAGSLAVLGLRTFVTAVAAATAAPASARTTAGWPLRAAVPSVIVGASTCLQSCCADCLRSAACLLPSGEVSKAVEQVVDLLRCGGELVQPAEAPSTPRGSGGQSRPSKLSDAAMAALLHFIVCMCRGDTALFSCAIRCGLSAACLSLQRQHDTAVANDLSAGSPMAETRLALKNVASATRDGGLSLLLCTDADSVDVAFLKDCPLLLVDLLRRPLGELTPDAFSEALSAISAATLPQLDGTGVVEVLLGIISSANSSISSDEAVRAAASLPTGMPALTVIRETTAALSQLTGRQHAEASADPIRVARLPAISDCFALQVEQCDGLAVLEHAFDSSCRLLASLSGDAAFALAVGSHAKGKGSGATPAVPVSEPLLLCVELLQMLQQVLRLRSAGTARCAVRVFSQLLLPLEAGGESSSATGTAREHAAAGSSDNSGPAAGGAGAAPAAAASATGKLDAAGSDTNVTTGPLVAAIRMHGLIAHPELAAECKAMIKAAGAAEFQLALRADPHFSQLRLAFVQVHTRMAASKVDRRTTAALAWISGKAQLELDWADFSSLMVSHAPPGWLAKSEALQQLYVPPWRLQLAGELVDKGVGGFGMVQRCHLLSDAIGAKTRQDAAVKISLPSDRGAAGEKPKAGSGWCRLLQEARILAELTAAQRRLVGSVNKAARLRACHVRLLAVTFAPDGSPAIIMERMDGNLRKRLCEDADEEIPMMQRIAVAACAASAVATLHKYRIIHSDIKAENLLYSAKAVAGSMESLLKLPAGIGSVCMADFGCAVRCAMPCEDAKADAKASGEKDAGSVSGAAATAAAPPASAAAEAEEAAGAAPGSCAEAADSAEVREAVAGGTLHYWAPELVKQRLDGAAMNVTYASDVYALAITIASIIKRNSPFAGCLTADEERVLKGAGGSGAEGRAALYQWYDMIAFPRWLSVRSLQRDRCRPRLPDDTPAAVSDLLARCWLTHPERRPSAKEVADTLYAIALASTASAADGSSASP